MYLNRVVMCMCEKQQEKEKGRSCTQEVWHLKIGHYLRYGQSWGALQIHERRKNSLTHTNTHSQYIWQDFLINITMNKLSGQGVKD